MKHGMHCLGCAAAHFETLEQGCGAHGIDVDELVKDLNAAVKAKKEEE
jgi:hybrid cluster-associated redox disulfide protein